MNIDAECRPMFLNAVAERLVARRRWLALAAGRLGPAHHGGRSGFAEAVAGAAQTSGGRGLMGARLFQLADPVEGALPIVVAPFRAPALAFGPERPAVLVQFSDPDRPRATALGAAYGLSAGESRLVEALLGGASLSAYARAAGVTVNTVRTQLARVFAKTDTARQQDLLIKVISELPAMK
ncbi:hypothetical protein P1J78_21165 [Psychromarinibacter sp. C21-152]|uniref:HTH luxR-type domain-containing protein n=1 Tax=Psychromarinibacter sediminicola TaxID=3033385 RepID=A0AAE3NTH6_9RHOB|nr:hypothetical protein [Psychromarinibacter sediminicola]MDF0603253.1 hypothetical protein [Psychromarinibacter sediminicola]